MVPKLRVIVGEKKETTKALPKNVVIVGSKLTVDRISLKHMAALQSAGYVIVIRGGK